MARLAIPLTVLAAALAGCATNEPYNPPAPSAAVTTTRPAAVVASGSPLLVASGPVQPGSVIVPAATWKAGSGVVESIAAVHITPAGAASAGASAPQRMAYRLTLRMDDGSLQAVDEDNRNFMVGDRVDISANGQVVRH